MSDNSPVEEAHVDGVEAQSLCERCHYAPGSLELQGLCLGCWQHGHARALRRDLTELHYELRYAEEMEGENDDLVDIVMRALSNPLLEGTDDA